MMKKSNIKKFFLNQNSDLSIRLFSIWHITLIIITLTIILIIVTNKDKLIKCDKNTRKKIRIFFSCILILNIILRRGSFIFYNVYDYHLHLDINLCNFLSILYIIYGITGSKKIYPICYYFTFIGPLIAILFPCVNFSTLNYSFYSFLIIHYFLFIFNIIFLYLENYKYNKKDLQNTIIFLIIYFIIIYLFNYLFNTTYLSPTEFVNDDLLNNIIIKIIFNSKLLTYVVYYLIIVSLLLIGKICLKILNNDKIRIK